MKKNLLLIVLLMTLIPLAGYSQNETSTQFTVAGVIVDATGEPLVGTAVYVKNEPGVGVVADLDGKFKIKVTKNATLIFQSVGMKNVEMLITKNEEKLKIVMKEDETKIDEVVVTGMSSQKKVSVVSISSNLPSRPSISTKAPLLAPKVLIPRIQKLEIFLPGSPELCIVITPAIRPPIILLREVHW